VERRAIHLVLTVAACLVAGIEAAETQEHGVFYLEKWKLPPLQLKALGRTPLVVSPNENRLVACLAKGQPVTVIALGDAMDYVAARTATDEVRGWVDVKTLESPPDGLLEELRKRRERAAAHQESIARHEVALGMTREEVRASFGKPGERLNVRTADGEREQWIYETFRYLPTYQYDRDEKGQVRQMVSYAKTRVGRKVVTFRGDEVIVVADEVAGAAPALSPFPSGGN